MFSELKLISQLGSSPVAASMGQNLHVVKKHAIFEGDFTGYCRLSLKNANRYGNTVTIHQRTTIGTETRGATTTLSFLAGEEKIALLPNVPNQIALEITSTLPIIITSSSKITVPSNYYLSEDVFYPEVIATNKQSAIAKKNSHIYLLNELNTTYQVLPLAIDNYIYVANFQVSCDTIFNLNTTVKYKASFLTGSALGKDLYITCSYPTDVILSSSLYVKTLEQPNSAFDPTNLEVWT